MSRVRKAIGQNRSGTPLLIQTLHAKGYRFIGKLDSDESLPPAAAPVQANTPGDIPPVRSVEHAQQPLLVPTAVESVAGERRQLTVLSCNIADLDKITSATDPEQWHEMMQGFRTACLHVIERFEGSLAPYLQRNLLIYFGYPQAHEDDARRAIHSALRIANLSPAFGVGVQLAIHTGDVIIDVPDSGHERLPQMAGATVAIATGLQDLAPRQGVLISAVTAQLVQGYFKCQEFGSYSAAGQTLPVYRVLAESDHRTRMQVAAALGLTPFVGREAELALLRERWQQVGEGRGQTVVLSGEAGIGKSRLLQVLKAHIDEGVYTLLECHCSPYYRNITLYPFITLLQRLAQWQPADSAAAKLSKLENLLQRRRQPLAQTIPLLAALLSLELPQERYPDLTISPQHHHQQLLLTTLLILLLEAARQQPLLLIVEDLHWADPGTLELVELLIQQTQTIAVLAIFTCRPDFQPDWKLSSQYTQLVLGQLSQAQTEQMLHHLLLDRPPAHSLLQQLVARSDGVPLFIEELTGPLMQSYQTHEPGGVLTIPVTLQNSLRARLDRLHSGREIAQWAAVLGKEFSYAMLAAVMSVDEAALQQGLDQLVKAGLLLQNGLIPQAHFAFKYALLQEAVYSSLLKNQRQPMHRHIARVLETQFPDLVASCPELLARHDQVS
jgi:class 3 adenylate cyclase